MNERTSNPQEQGDESTDEPISGIAVQVVTAQTPEQAERVTIARSALDAVTARIADLQARLQPTQDAYRAAANQIDSRRHEPDPLHPKGLMARRAMLAQQRDVIAHRSRSSDVMLQPTGNLSDDVKARDQFRRDCAKDLADCDARLAELDSQIYGFSKQKADGEKALKSIDLQTRQARLELERAEAEYDAARLAAAVLPHAEFVADLVRRVTPEQFLALVRAALVSLPAMAA